MNNVGRFFGFSVPALGAAHTPGFWTEAIPWFAFPVLPLAAYAVWRRRTVALSRAPLQFSLVSTVLLSAVLAASASARVNYALPLLLPLAVTAAPAVADLPAALNRWSSRISLAAFGGLALLIWSGWIAMQVRGAALELPWVSALLPASYVPHFDPTAFMLAVVLSAAAVWLAWRARDADDAGTVRWFLGLTLVWGLLSALWLPWIDEAKSYRSVFRSMAGRMPPNYRCIASYHLEESERGMLRYFLGVTTQRLDNGAGRECDLFLVESKGPAPPGADPQRWTLLWSGARPGDTKEHFYLFDAESRPAAAS